MAHKFSTLNNNGIRNKIATDLQQKLFVAKFRENEWRKNFSNAIRNILKVSC